jgi:hypothetical protein
MDMQSSDKSMNISVSNETVSHNLTIINNEGKLTSMSVNIDGQSTNHHDISSVAAGVSPPLVTTPQSTAFVRTVIEIPSQHISISGMTNESGSLAFTTRYATSKFAFLSGHMKYKRKRYNFTAATTLTSTVTLAGAVTVTESVERVSDTNECMARVHTSVSTHNNDDMVISGSSCLLDPSSSSSSPSSLQPLHRCTDRLLNPKEVSTPPSQSLLSSDNILLSAMVSTFIKSKACVQHDFATPQRFLCMDVIRKNLSFHRTIFHSAAQVNSPYQGSNNSLQRYEGYGNTTATSTTTTTTVATATMNTCNSTFSLQLCLSVKTQPHRDVLLAARELGYYAECISMAEVYHALDAGYDSTQIVLTGRITAWWDLSA